MGFVYEVVLSAVNLGVPHANVFHVWDGDENETPDDVADVFENNYITDIEPLLADTFTFSRLDVTPLDVGNGLDPISRVINVIGDVTTEAMPSGVHAWVKFTSEDNGFKAGGKLIGGLPEAAIQDGVLIAGTLTGLQAVFDNLVTDLSTASLALAIYRPSLSTPGFPSISICSAPIVRGVGTNNRRQAPYQL